LTGIPITVITDLAFEEDGQGLTRTEIVKGLDANPAWHGDNSFSALLRDLGGGSIRAVRVTPIQEHSSRRELLLQYLFGSSARDVNLSVVNRRHDGAFDHIVAEQVVNIPRLYHSIVSQRAALAISFAAHVRASRRSQDRSSHQGRVSARTTAEYVGAYLKVLRASVVDGDSERLARAEESLLTASDPNNRFFAFDRSSAVRAIARAVGGEMSKFIATLRGIPYRAPGAALAAAQEVVSEVELASQLKGREPNTLLTIALRDPILANVFGLVTKWVGWFPTDALSKLRGISLLGLHPEGSELPNGVEVEEPKNTAIKLRGEFVYVASRLEQSGNCALAWLNESGGHPRYVTTVVNADHEIVKSWMQQTREMSTSAKKQDPTDQTSFGISAPSSAGVVFSGPTEELIAANPPPADSIHFLETLAIGYCIDIQPETSRSYRSLYGQHVEYFWPQAQGLKSGERVAGASTTPFFSGITEGFIDREQLTSTGRVSTDFAIWTGTGPIQHVPWRAKAGPPTLGNAELAAEGILGKRVLQLANSLPRLRYESGHKYRIRWVLQGGARFSLEEADEFLSAQSSDVRQMYEQSFYFPRIEPFSAGVLASKRSEQTQSPRDDKTFYISSEYDDACERSILVAPQPLTMDQLLLHGVIGNHEDELERYRHVYLTTNVTDLLTNNPETLGRAKYFCDPTVSAINVSAWIIGHNLETSQVLVSTHESVLEHIPSRYVGTANAQFGSRSKWMDFRPITILISAKRRGDPEVRKAPFYKGSNTIEVLVPPGRVVELVIAPDLSADAITRAVITNEASPYLKRPLSDALLDVLRAYAIQEQTIRVVHVVRRPLSFLQIEQMLIKRERDEAAGRVLGRIVVDGETTGRCEILLSWTDIEDDPAQPSQIHKAGSMTGPMRDVRFERAPIIPASNDANVSFEQLRRLIDNPTDADEAYLVENLLLYPRSGRDDASEGNEAITLPDSRRRIITAIARGYSRFAAYLDPGMKAGPHFLDSRSVLIDVPNTGLPPAVNGYAVPTLVDMIRKESSEGTIRITRAFSFRIYINRPWLCTGPGERLAIVCADGSLPQIAEEKLPITYWGEDVLELPRLSASRRLPTPQDFGSPVDNAVDYLSGISAPWLDVQDVGTSTTVGLASYAPAFDERQQLWWCDVQIRSDFFGWLALAVYRHQPHSVSSRHLSRSPAWFYVRQLQEEIVTYSRREEFLEVRVGPTYDATISYDLCTVSQLSQSITSLPRRVATLAAVETDGATIHYVRVRLTPAPLVLRRLRGGEPNASIRIT
jgi:hypothetical protein